jgi:hypothetical protein
MDSFFSIFTDVLCFTDSSEFDALGDFQLGLTTEFTLEFLAQQEAAKNKPFETCYKSRVLNNLKGRT